ncbi:MAG: glycosyltransferase family 2 protein, partial [Acidimicrobiaceae bacterium]
MVTLAVAMPVFNEADGIRETLGELNHAFKSVKEDTHFFIQDDQSTDNTVEIITKSAEEFGIKVFLESNPNNLGHGPTVINAYLRAIKSDAEVVLQLDSDGQFNPSELIKLLDSVRGGTDLAIGVRKSRVDPWFRILLTKSLRILLFIRFRKYFVDPNSPIRAYKRETLRGLISQIPSNALIPNIYLVVIARLRDKKIENFVVTHRDRRGNSKTGSTWVSKSKLKSLTRLSKFAVHALRELTA